MRISDNRWCTRAVCATKMNMLHRKIRVNNDFGASKVVTSRVADKEHGKLLNKFEHVDLQALLDEDDSQAKLLAQQLGVSQQLFPRGYERWEEYW